MITNVMMVVHYNRCIYNDSLASLIRGSVNNTREREKAPFGGVSQGGDFLIPVALSD